jgi:hypothetical protein
VDPKLLLDPAFELAEIIAQGSFGIRTSFRSPKPMRADSRSLFATARITMLSMVPAAFMEMRQPQLS